VGVLAAAGGTTALAASPSPAASPGQSQAAPRKHAADVRQGVIIKLSDTSMTIERSVRDKITKAVTKDDVTLAINKDTKVFRAGSKDPLGHDALKLGERVRVRFDDDGTTKTARRIVILPDLRAGEVIAKGNDYFVLHTPQHGDVKVVVTDKTTYRSDRADGTFAALKVGDHAVALGEEDSAHNFDARRVRYDERPDTDRTPATAPAPAATPAA
jgi:hypothetical protein